ncbi:MULTISPECIES: dicarboxylate/amino acid:cation symporter [Streptomyces]|uniref:Dicarboxylate/amino acid:cation symporter n=1 Tax=Streptomyces thermoviolaceus subsp. thermoviolaceus TaxID=66860 RepID=A0ABX0YZ10_STRTL|nr:MULTISPECIES: dicarboxylate/amino acid:cation symporter [Streptomyces]WTD46183.1 dicarboxylate/amino acid:cation symporter [Streptomyces thermoviolaceus]NJP17529.1 dicarboxylate/amino acid:cation symporter [Streptomyces thermoviolaceus subsp. thermoviolaceus]RSS06727.1 dicarboxylate/amino acid:cation symporter [Streptomyces sp. WAC00469]GGV65419.1 sodium:proton antiporter [Streptomyces thermoviolaceus subsp. apingens]GHA75117.1 sodium:proton antiporter [Streptomyces thermoviolaceus subsp. t
MSSNTTESKPATARRRIPVPFWAQVLLGLVVGLVLGFVARTYDVSWLATTLDKVGGIFVQLLKLAVAPLVFFAIMVSITNLRKVNNAARLAGRTLMWFMITSLIAVVIGLVIGLVSNPGSGSDLTPADGAKPEHAGSWLDFLTGIIPTDVVTPFTELNVLQIVFMAVVAGVAVLKIGPKAQPLLSLSETVLELLQKALWWVILLAPIGSAGLIGRAIVQYGWDLLGNYATFTVDIYVGCLLVLFGVYPLLLATVGKLNPLQFFKGAWPAIQLAFVSRSSVGTMPVTQQSAIRLGVPLDYASFAVPFGATTKMDGCAAIYPAISAIFVSQIFDVPLGVKEYVLIAFVSVIGSAATAGLTGATVMLTLTLSTLGLPMEGVGLLLAIDPILDMMRTATNVAGQALVPVIVSAREKILDRTKYDTVTASPVEEDETVRSEPQPAATVAG